MSVFFSSCPVPCGPPVSLRTSLSHPRVFPALSSPPLASSGDLGPMARVQLPLEESDLLSPWPPTITDLISDDDWSVAADSWSIKSEYGNTLGDEHCHIDAAEVLAGGNFPATTPCDHSSDKDELDTSEVEASMLGFQSYWDASYAEDLANFHEHGHAGEIWFGVEVMDTVASWTKNLCSNMSHGWNAADDSNLKTESCKACKDFVQLEGA